MSKKDDDKGDPIIERVASLEATVKFHEQRLQDLEKGIDDIRDKLNEVLQTTRGMNFFLRNIALPIVMTIITAFILRVIV